MNPFTISEKKRDKLLKQYGNEIVALYKNDMIAHGNLVEVTSGVLEFVKERREYPHIRLYGDDIGSEKAPIILVDLKREREFASREMASYK